MCLGEGWMLGEGEEEAREMLCLFQEFQTLKKAFVSKNFFLEMNILRL